MAYIKVILLLGVSILVSSCASGSLLGKDPRCPFSEKGGCQSVKSINKMIDENKYIAGGDFVQNKDEILVCKTCKASKKMQVYIPDNAQSSRPSKGHIEIIEIESWGK
jgi:hypothetical protein